MAAAIWLVAVILLILAVRKAQRTRGRFGVGTGAVGPIYDMLNEDKRRAVEIIVEERAEAQDPEDKDGNLPDLADPRRSRLPNP
jgi:hypothetical protein